MVNVYVNVLYEIVSHLTRSSADIVEYETNVHTIEWNGLFTIGLACFCIYVSMCVSQ